LSPRDVIDERRDLEIAELKTRVMGFGKDWGSEEVENSPARRRRGRRAGRQATIIEVVISAMAQTSRRIA
jgi:hypothetical protein